MDLKLVSPIRFKEKNQELGSGSFGSVFPCKAKSDLRDLCLKCPHHGEDLTSEMEFNLLIGPHKYVCQMEYFINSLKGVFLIFERYSSSLSSYFAKLGRIDERQARLIFAQTHLALAYVYSLGYVHHDVNPDNILITTSGNVKLADFNLLIKMQK
ncbi:Serine/threonine-protein kinase PEPKR2-like protein, partial [Dinothrombium tinctorium]